MVSPIPLHCELSVYLSHFNGLNGHFLTMAKVARASESIWLPTKRPWRNLSRSNLLLTFVNFIAIFISLLSVLIWVLLARILWWFGQTTIPWLCTNLWYCLEDFHDLISSLRIRLAPLLLLYPSLALRFSNLTQQRPRVPVLPQEKCSNKQMNHLSLR